MTESLEYFDAYRELTNVDRVVLRSIGEGKTDVFSISERTRVSPDYAAQLLNSLSEKGLVDKALDEIGGKTILAYFLKIDPEAYEKALLHERLGGLREFTLTIFSHMEKGKPVRPSEIGKKMGQNHNLVGSHLRSLEQAGLVRSIWSSKGSTYEALVDPRDYVSGKEVAETTTQRVPEESPVEKLLKDLGMEPHGTYVLYRRQQVRFFKENKLSEKVKVLGLLDQNYRENEKIRTELGATQSSLNSMLTRMVKDGLVKRQRRGVYENTKEGKAILEYARKVDLDKFKGVIPEVEKEIGERTDKELVELETARTAPLESEPRVETPAQTVSKEEAEVEQLLKSLGIEPHETYVMRGENEVRLLRKGELNNRVRTLLKMKQGFRKIGEIGRELGLDNYEASSMVFSMKSIGLIDREDRGVYAPTKEGDAIARYAIAKFPDKARKLGYEPEVQELETAKALEPVKVEEISFKQRVLDAMPLGRRESLSVTAQKLGVDYSKVYGAVKELFKEGSLTEGPDGGYVKVFGTKDELKETFGEGIVRLTETIQSAIERLKAVEGVSKGPYSESREVITKAMSQLAQAHAAQTEEYRQLKMSFESLAEDIADVKQAFLNVRVMPHVKIDMGEIAKLPEMEEQVQSLLGQIETYRMENAALAKEEQESHIKLLHAEAERNLLEKQADGLGEYITSLEGEGENLFERVKGLQAKNKELAAETNTIRSERDNYKGQAQKLVESGKKLEEALSQRPEVGNLQEEVTKLSEELEDVRRNREDISEQLEKTIIERDGYKAQLKTGGGEAMDELHRKYTGAEDRIAELKKDIENMQNAGIGNTATIRFYSPAGVYAFQERLAQGPFKRKMSCYVGPDRCSLILVSGDKSVITSLISDAKRDLKGNFKEAVLGKIAK